MAKADWTIVTDGGWLVETDEAASPTHSIKLVSGWNRFVYSGGSALLNSRVYGSMKCVGDPTGVFVGKGMGLLGRAVSIVAPYTMYMASIWAYTTSGFNYTLTRWKAGVYTLLKSGTGWAAVPAGTARSAFHQFRFSVTEEFSQSVLRLEYYNTTLSAWVSMWEYDDGSVDRISAAGRAGFYLYGETNNIVYVDDIQVVELT